VFENGVFNDLTKVFLPTAPGFIGGPFKKTLEIQLVQKGEVSNPKNNQKLKK